MTSTLSFADTSDMVGLHQVFRDALAAAPQLLGDGASGDAARVQTVAGFYDTVLRLLHTHHQGEDELMTPLLAARCTPQEAAAITRIAGQHADVLADLTAAETTLAAWRTDPDPTARSAALAALTQLEASLCPHLDEEEHVVLPIAARHLNVAEWGQLPEHGMKAFQGDDLWLVLGLVQEQMPAPAIADMEAHLPPPLLQAWHTHGKQVFTDRIAAVRR